MDKHRESQPTQSDLNPAAPSWLARNAPYLVLGVGIIGWMIYKGWDLQGFATIAEVGLGVGFIIFVHELGHFAVAKWCDVHVETFSIGFGPAIPGCSYQYGETTYMLAVVPLGGYVKMVGEGGEDNEGDGDPRAFKNKAVWQRMAIISAGVIMNIVTAFMAFVYVFMTHGDVRIPGQVDAVEAGSPAFKNGLRTGDEFRQIGNKENPHFDDLQPIVTGTAAGDKISLTFSAQGADAENQFIKRDIEPRMDKNNGDSRPVIGVSPPLTLELEIKRHASPRYKGPVVFGSPAARAEPPFEFGDTIIGTTDPENPDKIKPVANYFEFERRLVDLAGKEMVIEVKRLDGGTANIKVPPAYHWTLGMSMRMGPITAIREIERPGPNGASSGNVTSALKPDDIIEWIQFRDKAGKQVRFNTAGGSKDKKDKPAGVEVLPLNPVSLAYDMSSRIDAKKPNTVTVKVLRPNPPDAAAHVLFSDVTAEIPWQDGWQYAKEYPLYLGSSLSIPGLGIAYRVDTTIEAVTPGGPATHARVEADAKIIVKKGDVITRDGKEVDAAEGEFQLLKGDTISLRPG